MTTLLIAVGRKGCVACWVEEQQLPEPVQTFQAEQFSRSCQILQPSNPMSSHYTTLVSITLRHFRCYCLPVSSFPSGFPIYVLYGFSFSSCPAQPIQFYSIALEYMTMHKTAKLLITQLSPPSCYLLLVRICVVLQSTLLFLQREGERQSFKHKAQLIRAHFTNIIFILGLQVGYGRRCTYQPNYNSHNQSTVNLIANATPS